MIQSTRLVAVAAFAVSLATGNANADTPDLHSLNTTASHAAATAAGPIADR